MHQDSKVALEKTSLKDAASIEDGEVEEKEKTVRQKLAAFLQCDAVQYTVIAFVVIDGIIVILELLIDLEIIKFAEEDGHGELNATNSDNNTYAADETTQLPLMVMPDPHHGNGGHHHVKHHGRHHNHHNEHSLITQTIATVTHYLLNGTSDDYNGSLSLHGHGHDDDHHGDHHGAHHHSKKEIAEHTLHLCSLIILCLFLVEVICKIIAEGKHLLKHKAEVLDAFVVVISFTLDVVFSFVDVAQAAKDAAGLMVMLRLWRVTRLINGVIISVQMEADKKVHKIEMVLHASERENEQLRNKLKLLQEELEMLKNKMKKPDSISESTSQSALQNVSQKTDEDVIDILMGWDSPQFLNSHSDHTPLTPSPATTTTASTTSVPAVQCKDLKSSSTSQSSKSMFMVFEEKKDKSAVADGRTTTQAGPKPPVFVVPVGEGSPKHTATTAAYEAENHPHQILHFPQPASRRGSKDGHPNLSSIQPYISPNYPVPESSTKKKMIISPTQPIAPKPITGDQPIKIGSEKQSIESQSGDIPRKPSVSSPADQKKESNGRTNESSRPAEQNKQLALSDPQVPHSAVSSPAGLNTPPTSGSDQAFPLIPPPTSGSGQKVPLIPPPTSGSDQKAPLIPPPTSGSGQKVPLIPPPTSGSDQKIPLIPPPTSGSDHKVPPIPPPPTSGSDQVIPLIPPPTSGSDQKAPLIPPPPTSGSDQKAPLIPPPPTSGSDQVVPLIPPPTSKRSSEGRKKSVPSSYSSGQQALKSPPKPENTVKSPIDAMPPGGKDTKKPVSGQSLDYGDISLPVEHPSPPAAIILPPVSSVATRKKSPNGQTSEYVPLKSPRQPSPPPQENVFFEIDSASRSSSFLGDAMSDAPAEKDPGAPR